MQEPLSNIELSALVGVPPQQIIKYSDLKQFNDISDLFTANPFRVVLLEEEVKKGHWVVAFTQNGKYFYFNSYGNAPDRDLEIIPRLKRIFLGEDRREFRRLLHGKKMWYNTEKWQGPTSETCGRWVALVATLAKVGFDGPEVNQYLQNVKNDDGILKVIQTPRTIDFTA